MPPLGHNFLVKPLKPFGRDTPCSRRVSVKLRGLTRGTAGSFVLGNFVRVWGAELPISEVMEGHPS
jgi:hypothetical protein